MKKQYKSFADWQVKGRFVIKGQKAKYKNKAGVPMFSIEQTSVKSQHAYNFGDYNEEIFDLDDGLTAFDIGADF